MGLSLCGVTSLICYQQQYVFPRARGTGAGSHSDGVLLFQHIGSLNTAYILSYPNGHHAMFVSHRSQVTLGSRHIAILGERSPAVKHERDPDPFSDTGRLFLKHGNPRYMCTERAKGKGAAKVCCPTGLDGRYTTEQL